MATMATVATVAVSGSSSSFVVGWVLRRVLRVYL